MKKIVLSVILLGLSSWPAYATNVSTADPAYPQTYEDIDSQPLRDQFNKFINDIDNLWAAIGPNFLEANQIFGALVSGKAVAISVPSCSGPDNALTWVADSGFGCNEIQAGDGGILGPAPALTVLAGPLSGAAATPTPRALTGGDLPLPSANTIGGVQSLSPTAHQFLTGISTSGVPTHAAPAFGDISGVISPSQIPLPTSSSIGGVQSIASVAKNFLTSIPSSGVPTQAQPQFTDIAGNISISQMASGSEASSSTVWRGDGTWATISGLYATNPVAGATAEYPLTEGTGTTVNDLSGNGNTATLSGSPPAWEPFGLGFNIGAFSNANEYIQTPVTTFKTIIINECAAPYPQAGGGAGVNLGWTFGGKENQVSLSVVPNGVQWTEGTWYPGIENIATSTHTTGVNTPTKLCSNIAWVTDTSDHIYIDGNEGSYNSQGTSSSNMTVSGGWAIGSLGPASNVSFETYWGYINYIVMYPGVLTQTQIQQEDAYITNKVSSRPAYPANTTASTSPASNVICVGDSLSAALNGSVWCNSTYMTLTNAYTFLPSYLGGDAAHYLIAPTAQRTIPLIAANGIKNYCNIWLGTNDLSAGYSVSQTWEAIQNIGAQVKKAGCLPIITTLTSRSGGSDLSNQSLDTLIRNGWQTYFVGINDIAAIPTLGATGSYGNPVGTCFSDGTHLQSTGSCYESMAGYATVGWNLARLINVLDGNTEGTPTVTASNAYVQSIGDNVVQQTPTASATNTLPECTGLTGTRRKIVNGSSSFNITMNTSASQTIVGSGVVSANTAAAFTCEFSGVSTAGNYWLRTQ